ncbi:MAG: hypothetical protein DMD83_09965 [Candidatus Rokuibacteriota bacterium]|nr:MAG: hypothetical protein DMD83_09965 [Candidatus Rokubacteria bacterium]
MSDTRRDPKGRRIQPGKIRSLCGRFATAEIVFEEMRGTWVMRGTWAAMDGWIQAERGQPWVAVHHQSKQRE